MFGVSVSRPVGSDSAGRWLCLGWLTTANHLYPRAPHLWGRQRVYNCAPPSSNTAQTQTRRSFSRQGAPTHPFAVSLGLIIFPMRHLMLNIYHSFLPPLRGWDVIFTFYYDFYTETSRGWNICVRTKWIVHFIMRIRKIQCVQCWEQIFKVCVYLYLPTNLSENVYILKFF